MPRPPDKSTPRPATLSAEELRARLDFDDPRLLRECELHVHRTGGPGGQHRNKVASAIRLVHRPTGFVVTATERRSQHENKARALSRLREAIALGVRCPLPEQITWPPTVHVQERRLKVNPKNPAYLQVLALALDALAACEGQAAKAAARLEVTPSSLTKFLAEHPKAATEVKRLRQSAGRHRGGDARTPG